MRKPTKAELETENARLQREVDTYMLLFSDLVNGNAILASDNGVHMLVTRLGSASGGYCARWGASITTRRHVVVDTFEHARSVIRAASQYASETTPDKQAETFAASRLACDAQEIQLRIMQDVRDRNLSYQQAAFHLPANLGPYHKVRFPQK